MPVIFKEHASEHEKMRWAEAKVGDAAWVLWTKACLWSDRNRTDGFVPLDVLPLLVRHKSPTTVAEALADAGNHLRRAGLFERVEGGYLIHNFLKHNYSAAEKDAKAKADRERKKSKPQGTAEGAARKRPGGADAPDGFQTESERKPVGVGTESQDFQTSSGPTKQSKDKDKASKLAGARAHVREGETWQPDPAWGVLPDGLFGKANVEGIELDDTGPGMSTLRRAWVACVGALGVIPSNIAFEDQHEALQGIWSAARADFEGELTIGRFMAALAHADGPLEAWRAEQGGFLRAWKPKAYAVWCNTDDDAPKRAPPLGSRHELPTDEEIARA